MKTLFPFFRWIKSKNAERSDLEPRGFRTTFTKPKMSIEEWNLHFKKMFEENRKCNHLQLSDYKK